MVKMIYSIFFVFFILMMLNASYGEVPIPHAKQSLAYDESAILKSATLQSFYSIFDRGR